MSSYGQKGSDEDERQMQRMMDKVWATVTCLPYAVHSDFLSLFSTEVGI